MTTSLTPALARPRGALRFLGLALLGSGVLAASAQVAVPFWPVPATLQTLAVLLLGALGGSRLGAAAVALTLAQGALGLPVFAGGTAGPAVLMGPTAGYLLGFLPAAWVAGQARGGWLRTGATLLAAHLLVFLPGVAWLAGFVGMEKALLAGFVLFIPGTLVKTGLALAGVALARRG
ncbi:biotin transporter BioY [Roseomonas sp. OT10]|uniref:biotin transporter BioY n=1 Tax=Roseomonas cutis TaxID=2897332 RepID=UPI001E573F52|nr:biotin transporter BioY [Roseomonas sp. OT10]UFN51269.1 biotin transporter BioY [Roseomonas sp. OT10]